MSARRYFTLCVREDGPWAPQFGDYDRGVVVAERDDYFCNGVPARCLKVIVSGDSQAAIDAAVAALNEVPL